MKYVFLPKVNNKNWCFSQIVNVFSKSPPPPPEKNSSMATGLSCTYPGSSSSVKLSKKRNLVKAKLTEKAAGVSRWAVMDMRVP